MARSLLETASLPLQRIAQITQPHVVESMLSSLGLPTMAPLMHGARGPPELF